MPTRHLRSSDARVNLLQDLIDDFFDCHKKYDALEEGDDVSDGVYFIATNRALPVAIAASLHALLKACLRARGELPSRDLLHCFTCIMTAMTGGGALDMFLRTRQADVPAQQLLFKSVSEEFNKVFEGNQKNQLLHGSFKQLHKSRIVRLLVNSSLDSVAELTALQDREFRRSVERMRTAKYFENSAWTRVVSGGMMQAEQMSWEMLAGQGGNGVLPLVQFEDPAVISRYISYLDISQLASMVSGQAVAAGSAADVREAGPDEYTVDADTGLMQLRDRSRRDTAKMDGWRTTLPENLSVIARLPENEMKSLGKRIKKAATRDVPLVLSEFGGPMLCRITHGVGLCVLQLSATCTSAKPVPVPDDEDEERGVYDVDDGLAGLVLGSPNYVPAFCFCGLARNLSGALSGGLDTSQYKDGQAGGYSIVACVVSKPMLLLKSDKDSGGSTKVPVLEEAGELVDPLNLRAVLDPLHVDTRLCPVTWKGTGAPAGKEFAAGDCSFPGFKLDLRGVVKDRSGGGATQYKGVFLEDLWISFGEGVPEDNDHTIPSRVAAMTDGSLPPYRLQLARDLLSRAGAVQGDVGKYVLYAGKAVPVRRGATGSRASKEWMEGLVISEQGSMREVLYLNGWVVWHARASFATQPRRTSRLVLMDTLTAVAAFLQESNDDAGADPLKAWVRETAVFRQFIDAGRGLMQRTENETTLLDKLKKTYKEFS